MIITLTEDVEASVPIEDSINDVEVHNYYELHTDEKNFAKRSKVIILSEKEGVMIVLDEKEARYLNKVIYDGIVNKGK